MLSLFGLYDYLRFFSNSIAFTTICSRFNDYEKTLANVLLAVWRPKWFSLS